MLKSVLKDIGLTKNETTVYLESVKQGPTEAIKLVQETGIARTQMYAILRDLMKKWLISEVVWNRKKIYTPEDISRFKEYLVSKRKSIEERIDLVVEKENEVQELLNVEQVKTQVKYYEGRKGVEKVYAKAFAGDFYCFSDLARVETYFPDSFAGAKSKESFVGNKGKCVLTENPTAKRWVKETKDLDIETKLLDKKKEITIDMILYENTVVYISFTEGTITAVVISNPDIYASAKLQFDLLWERL